MTVALVLIGALTTLMRPFVEPPRKNEALARQDAFLARASRQLVDWQLLTQETLALARRQEKPILLVVGTAASGFGRDLDTFVFTDSEVARYMNTNFVCLRVDGLDHPEILNAFLPLTRLEQPFSASCQVWVLDSAADIVAFIGRPADAAYLSRESFLDALIAATDSFRLLESQGVVPAAAISHAGDVAAIARGGTTTQPNFRHFLGTVRVAQDLVNGGFPRGEVQLLRPQAIRYLFDMGQTETGLQSLRPFLVSPIFDLQDGGFFRLSDTRNNHQVEFNKEAISNAEMLGALGVASCLSDDPLYGFAGRQTFDLLDRRMRVDNRLAAFDAENIPRQVRNERYSFNLRRMRETMSDEERTWARDHLGLDIPVNPQMTPFLRDEQAFEAPEFGRVLHQIRQANARRPRMLMGLGYLDVEAMAAARMVEWARLADDDKRLRRALLRVDELKQFRSVSGLRQRDDSSEPANLPGYLAYADAQYQAFLATGDESYLGEGQARLLSAVSRFATNVSGSYRLTEGPIEIPAAAMPEIADNTRESTTAMLIRVLCAYRRVDADREVTPRIEQLMSRFSSLVGGAGVEAAGFHRAALLTQEEPYAVAVGSDAAKRCGQLARMVPTETVEPATTTGPTRGRAPGIYVIGATIEGPLSVHEAARRLAAAKPSARV